MLVTWLILRVELPDHHAGHLIDLEGWASWSPCWSPDWSWGLSFLITMLVTWLILRDECPWSTSTLFVWWIDPDGLLFPVTMVIKWMDWSWGFFFVHDYHGDHNTDGLSWELITPDHHDGHLMDCPWGFGVLDHCGGHLILTIQCSWPSWWSPH